MGDYGRVIFLAPPAAPCPILTYHDVTPRKTVWFDCTPGEFSAQIGAMRRAGVTFVSLQRLYEARTGGRPLPPRAMAITFADNYRGFLLYAWPVLKKYGIPSAQFVHTGYVGSKVGRPKMSWEELRRLDRTGLVTVASQTVTHPADLRAMSDAAVLKEFVDSRVRLERKLGRPVRELAYPNGKYDARVAALAGRAGYRMAFTEVTRPSSAAPDLWRIPRYVHTRWREALRAVEP